MNRLAGSSSARRTVAFTASLTLASCGVFGGTDSSPPPTPVTRAALLDPAVSVTAFGSAASSPLASSALPGSSSALPGSATEVIGFDVLPDVTVADAEEIGALAYGIEAAADPFRITISPTEQECLTKASSELTDDQIDAALAWDDTSGDFTAPVADCLVAANREAFAVWHQIDTDLADATDQQYRCVEEGLATGATREHLDSALTSCGVGG